MELSKMGPPLNSSTATISLRRRPDSFRAAASGAAVESWLILLSPPRWSRLLGCVVPARFPSVLHESPAVDSHDRIYCVPWCRRDQFTIRHIVDMATWREAFDHEALHSWAVQGSAPRPGGQSA
ncbi:hypothetical protein GCM10022207_12980 [Streptomyces lannensis]|uniref:Uncharacterized protein n=1 Tax=Streptomyces lannensis TaxID=766498 RepID=A0ABP7JQY7_9ACTN